MVVEEIETTPPLREAADLQTKLWLGDGYEAQLEAAEREGDPGALAACAATEQGPSFDAASLSKALTRRATLTREWLQFFEIYSVLLMPCRPNCRSRRARSARRRFVRSGVARAIAANCHSLHGPTALTVSTGLVGRSPVGVQVVSGRYREICAAGARRSKRGNAADAVDPVDE